MPRDESQLVYGELLFRQARWHTTLLRRFLYVIDSKRALSFGEVPLRIYLCAQPQNSCVPVTQCDKIRRSVACRAAWELSLIFELAAAISLQPSRNGQ